MRKFLSCLLLLTIVYSCSKDEDKEEIESQEVLSRKIDGPYVMHEGEQMWTYRINDDGGLSVEQLTEKKSVEVVAPRMTPERFTFDIQQEYSIPSSVTEGNPTIFATSDIEGNYHAFTKLLIGNGVTDEKLNWSYGSNHLVLVGDMVDRGSFVTQVLWLIYKLDKQAALVGGEVHFILGNHDIMCMKGDDRYAADKYLDVARLMKISYKDLFGEDAEIGRWMRTKNSIEKIGDYIFVHGGISTDVLNLSLSIEELNEKVKPYYGYDNLNTAPLDVRILYETSGLFWYRGYVKEKEGAYTKATLEELNKILKYYEAKSIIVGHCVVDEIGTDYEGGVVTIDVSHPVGSYSNKACQALLIENGVMYKVNERAKRVQLRK